MSLRSGIGKGVNTVKNVAGDFKEHWNVPKDGNFVPYKEYVSVFFGVGGDYSLRYVFGFLGFGSGCYLIMYYYNIPLLAFSAIGAFFTIQGYFWSILNMIINDNLGFVPKRTEKIFYSIYGFFTFIGILFLCLDFSQIINFPSGLQNYIATIPGMTMRSVCKIFGVHWFSCGYFGIRNIFVRKKFLPKYGRFKYSFYPNVIPCIVCVLLICWLPIYEWYANDQAERIWILYLLFTLYNNYGITSSAQNISHMISPNTHERMLVRCYPEKLGHVFNSIWVIVLPIISAYTGGQTNINTYKYIIPALLILNMLLMWLGIRNIKERIPQPPLEKKQYVPFWDGISGILKNKYRWITAISGMIDSLGNGGLSAKTIILIYTWREQGLIFSLMETLIRMAGNPGAFLAPWIRKRFQYKTLAVFRRIVLATQSAFYIIACIVFKDNYFLCGLVMFISLFIGDMLNSAIVIADEDMGVRIGDYQMYLSGERLDNYAGVLGWITGPVSAVISLIIPIMYYRCGFTSDWNVLFVDDIRTKCMIIGVAFDLVGHILCCLPYLLFWDYTDEKHDEVMRILTERADKAEAELAAERGEAAPKENAAANNSEFVEQGS